MKNIDTFSKRVLIIAVSISIVLLSASVFVFTIQRVTATPMTTQPSQEPHCVGLGVDTQKRIGYYMLTYPGGSFKVYTTPLP